LGLAPEKQVLIESLVKLESFVLKSTFHIYICGWVIGVMHAWKEGKLVSNEGTNRSGILGLFSQAEGG
jgi:hypothetical protein